MQVKLNDWQSTAWNDNHRFRVICAGRRSGKSTFAQLTVINWASKEVGLYWIVAPTYVQAKQIHWQGIQHYVPQKLISKKNESDLSIALTNGSVIQLKSAENPDSLRGVKLRGLVVDEVASIRNWPWLWQEVLRATLTDYEAPALFIGTPKGFNHFYELFEEGQQVGSLYKSFRFTSYDNPYIPKQEIDQAKKELTDDNFQQEYMADFRKYTGLVYKDFQREIHTIEPFDIPESWSVYRGYDYGTTNPTVFLWIAVDVDDNWFIVDEIYESNQTPPYFAGRLHSHPLDSRVVSSYGDPSAAGPIMDYAKNYRVFITPATKEVGTAFNTWVRSKIDKVTEKLKVIPGRVVPSVHGREGLQGMPRLFVFPNCTNTIREFETYRWKEKSVTQAQDLNEPDVPEKANDHAMDALSYFACSYSKRDQYPIISKKNWQIA